MTKFLLSCMAASVAASAMASSKTLTPVRVLDNVIPEKSVTVTKGKLAAQSCAGSRYVKVLDYGGSGLMYQKRLKAHSVSNTVDPFCKKAKAPKANSKAVLTEDFEGWDGIDINWLPEGFAYRHDSDREGAQVWEITPEGAFQGMLGGLTGNCISINYDTEYLDEWLLFPEVTLGDNMVLTMDVYNDGVWYFSMENIDWDAFEYIGDKVIAYDQQVMISEDGGKTWKLLKSLAEDFMDKGFEELYMESTNALSSISVSLADYSGKTVKLAFRYVGTDGNLGVVDNIFIGNPPLEVSYSNPFGSLFFGMSPESRYLNFSILTGPVYRPILFENTTYNDDAIYTWNYFGPESTWLTADSQDYLEVTYHTDYTNESSTVNNLYYMPELSGEAPGYSAGSFTRGKYLQAGGKGQFLVADANGNTSIINLGLSVIDPATEGNTTVADAGQPIFGYSEEVDRIWTDYTFGDSGDEDNYVKLTAYMDYFFPSEYPMVIRGIHAPASGRVKDGVRFKAEIVPLSEKGVPEDPIAVAECGYDDLDIYETGGVNNFLNLNFTFSEPVVMSSDVCMAYLVRISGFNDPDHVEIFSPWLSENSNPDEMALGWIQKTIVMDGNARESLTPVANYVEDYLAFYIMLDAEFPWLEGPESVSDWNNMTASAVLDSSVEGKELSFENLPGWLTASAEGQYDKTVVTFHAAMTEEIKEDAEVTVSAPGVRHTILVKAPEFSGVKSVDSVNGASRIYNVSGMPVNTMEAPGIYIVKDASGVTRKITVK
ncbi:MAG: choice-of-anchor J domain-containing protein [Muribaculaceae bacterium]|nr:choice-of-anchor J domain-containing protein [Muribaculaceae bacterium]